MKNHLEIAFDRLHLKKMKSQKKILQRQKMKSQEEVA
jgi:hypothetical protein